MKKVIPMSKEDFANYIRQIQKAYDYAEDCEDGFLVRYNSVYFMQPTTKLLDKLFNSYWEDQEYYGGDIEYFCYELNFGRDYNDGDIVDKDGNNIDLSTPEKLYDFLVNNYCKGE